MRTSCGCGGCGVGRGSELGSVWRGETHRHSPHTDTDTAHTQTQPTRRQHTAHCARVHTMVLLASRSSSVSPMQAMTVMPFSTANAVLRATSTSVSPCDSGKGKGMTQREVDNTHTPQRRVRHTLARRSEWPMMVYLMPASVSIVALVSPVYAPLPVVHASCRKPGNTHEVRGQAASEGEHPHTPKTQRTCLSGDGDVGPQRLLDGVEVERRRRDDDFHAFADVSRVQGVHPVLYPTTMPATRVRYGATGRQQIPGQICAALPCDAGHFPPRHAAQS